MSTRDTVHADHRPRDWLPTIVFGAVALLTSAWGAVAMWKYGWRYLYADQWRLYERFVILPFPDNVLFLENGHRPIVPNLLRVAELNSDGGSQIWQLTVGVALASLAVIGMCWMIGRDQQLAPVGRALGCLFASLGIFWLGNARMLMHPNESVHTYLIVILLVLLAGLLHLHGSRERAESWRMLCLFAGGLLVCGLIATFSFGPGIALLPAASMVLFARGASWARVALPLVVMTLVLVMYVFVLPGAEGVRDVVTIAPVDNIRDAFLWLGSLPLHLLQPWLDPSASHWLAGEALDGIAGNIAAVVERHHGPFHDAAWPAVPGMAGAIWLGWRTLAWRRRAVDGGGTELLGMLLAWFAIGVAVIIALSRHDYFIQHPAQIFANRYLPWVCLFWAGIGLMVLGALRRPTAGLLVTTFAVTVSALALNQSYINWSKHVQNSVLSMNVALAAGVVPAPVGETVEQEVLTGLPSISAAGVGLFGHAAAQRAGTVVGELPPAGYSAARVEWSTIEARRGDSAQRVEFTAGDDYPGVQGDLWLLVDANDIAVGLAHPWNGRSSSRVIGYLRQRPETDLRAYPWSAADRAAADGIRLSIGSAKETPGQ